MNTEAIAISQGDVRRLLSAASGDAALLYIYIHAGNPRSDAARVLGFSDRGQELLKQMKKTAALPVITKPAHARKLDEAGKRLFELESRCTGLYDLCDENIPAPGREWRMDVVRMGGRENG